MVRKTFKCTVSYKGTDFYGFQKQDKYLTVQGLFEYALKKFFGFEVKTAGAGRTDAGVHARGQVIAFTADTNLEAQNIHAILNMLLPPDIRVLRTVEMPYSFNPRWNVKMKLYRYTLQNGGDINPIHADLCWQLQEKLSVKKLAEAGKLFIGEHDFFSFSKAGGSSDDYVRAIKDIKVRSRGKWITVDFRGKSFLYNMIRRIMAVMVMYAKGEVNASDINNMLNNRDRALVRHTAPAQGLCLVKVTYERGKNAEKA